MQNERQKITRALCAIIACGFLATLGIGLVSFTLPLVSLDAKVSGTWLGTGFAGFFLARLLVGPLGGIWADKFSPRWPLMFATALAATTSLGYVVFPDVASLYVIQFILGVCSGLIRPVGLAVLGGNLPHNSLARWFSVHTLAFNAAAFVGPLLGGILYWSRTMTPILGGLSLCMIVAFVLILIFVPTDIATKGREERPQSDKHFDKKRFYALLLAIFGRTFGIGLTIAFYPILLTVTLGISGPKVGLLFALPGLITCLVLPLVPVLKRRYQCDFVMAGMLASGLGLMLAGVGGQLWHFVIAGIIMGTGAALSIPESMALASSSGTQQGRVFGVTHVVTSLGFVLGPLMGGLIIQSLSNIGYVFVVSGLVGWACLLMWGYYCPRYERLMPYGAVLTLFIMSVVATGLYLTLSLPTDPDDEFYQYTDVAMGTVVNLTLEADSRRAADDAARKALAFMRNIQRDLDHRTPKGSVYRINQSAGEHYVKPTKRAYALIRRAVDLAHASDGVFDPTIGALTTSPLYYVLDETVARAKADLVDYRQIDFDDENHRVLLRKKGMAIDLGGIAKGAIIDATVALLRKQHVRAGIVEAGGDFYCFGERDWTVGIRNPREESVYGTVTVREKGVCGSGDYQQFVKMKEAGETRLRHHIINPSDMESAEASAGVTVIANTAELADGLATALFIMGPDVGSRFVHEDFPDVAAMWFTRDMSVVVTDNFPQ